jgi:hypothetical protein
MQRYRVLGGSAKDAGRASAGRPAAEARAAAADRRKPNRPWNAGKTAPAREVSSAKVANSGGDDAVWKEF